MLLPYRAKNPQERFPYVTVGLIVLNVVIFALTSQYFLFLREDMMQQYALSHDTFSIGRMFSSMFLHGSLEHLLGNMLFLWLFGASVEGRLHHGKYLALYLLCGLSGDLLHEVIFGFARPEQFSLGASGAIMGVAGAYFFLFPYSTICVFWWLRFRMGVAEWQARWVILLYVGMDVVFGVLLRGGDGVGHMAHLGGFGMGLLLVFVLRAPRDSEETSNAQSVRAEMKDFSLLPLADLEALMQRPTTDIELILAYCEKALLGYQAQPEKCLAILRKHQTILITQADPNRVAYLLLSLRPEIGGLAPVYYLRVGGRLETMGSHDYAAQVYHREYTLYPQSPETEMALFRLAQLMERALRNPQYACTSYSEVLRLFPNGQMAMQARQELQRLQPAR